MYSFIFKYKSIMPEATGYNLKNLIKLKGYNVKDIQNILNLSCPQPIYRWFNGITMPSLNHLYVLSGFLHVHMDQMIVGGYADRYDVDDYEFSNIVFRLVNFLRVSTVLSRL